MHRASHSDTQKARVAATSRHGLWPLSLLLMVFLHSKSNNILSLRALWEMWVKNIIYRKHRDGLVLWALEHRPRRMQYNTQHETESQWIETIHQLNLSHLFFRIRIDFRFGFSFSFFVRWASDTCVRLDVRVCGKLRWWRYASLIHELAKEKQNRNILYITWNRGSRKKKS